MSSHSHHGVNFMKMKPGILGNRILEKQKKCFSMHYNYNKKSWQIFSLEKSDNWSPHPTIVACYCHACAQFEFWLLKVVKPPAEDKLILW